MKRLSAMLLLYACVSSTALAQGPGAKPGPGPGAGKGVPAEFELIVCNKSKELTFAAVGGRILQSGPDKHDTRVQGWWQVPPGECTKVGTLPVPGFLIHLRSPRGMTTIFKERPTRSMCVYIKDAFTSTFDSADQEPKPCPPSQELVMFHMIGVGQARTYTVTIDP